MEFAFKLIELFTPFLLEIISQHHGDKSSEEHNQIALDLMASHLAKSKK